MGNEVRMFLNNFIFNYIKNSKYQCCKLVNKNDQNRELSIRKEQLDNTKNKTTEACPLDYPPEVMLKNEIIKIYQNNDNNNEHNKKNNGMFLFNDDGDKTLIDSVKLKNVFSKSKKLILEIMANSSTEDKYSCIEINPYGYTNSKRGKKDGIAYFGSSLDPDNDTNEEIDVFLNNNIYDNNYFECDEGNFGKHFMIKFNPEDLNYYIQDFGKGFGTFIKIQGWTVITNNILVNIG